MKVFKCKEINRKEIIVGEIRTLVYNEVWELGLKWSELD